MDSKEPKALLAEIRSAGLTQHDVAKAMGITQGSVSKLERGTTKDVRSSAFRGLLELHQRVVPSVEKQAIVANVRADPAKHTLRRSRP